MPEKTYDPVAALRALVARDPNVALKFRDIMAPDLCQHDEPAATCDRCQNQREYEAGLRACRTEREERRYRSRNRPVLGIGGGY